MIASAMASAERAARSSTCAKGCGSCGIRGGRLRRAMQRSFRPGRTKHRAGHAVHHLPYVAIRQVRIPPCHVHLLVPQHLSNLEQCGAIQCEFGRARMSEIVKAEVDQAGPPARGAPGLLDEHRSLAVFIPRPYATASLDESPT